MGRIKISVEIWLKINNIVSVKNNILRLLDQFLQLSCIYSTQEIDFGFHWIWIDDTT